MEIKYSGKDVFKPNAHPPVPKFDTRMLYSELLEIMKKYGLDKLEVTNAAP